MSRMFAWGICGVLALAAAWPARAALQGSAFTYQGKLEQNGVPVQGTRNLRFRLFTEATGGTQVGADIVLPAQPVDAGVFTVPLDFGLLAFNGEARFLEVAVDDNTLAPRQLVTNAPYALFALDGGTPYVAGAGITLAGDTIAAKFGTEAGTVAEGNQVIRNSSTAQAATFNITSRGRMSDLLVDAQLGTIEDVQQAIRVRSVSFVGQPPLDRFRVDTAGGLVALGVLGFGSIPSSGDGVRMMWHPKQAAFRAGSTLGALWDESNTGFFSAAFGNQTRAAGNGSLAAGQFTDAAGPNSTAFGNTVTVSADSGFAAGNSNTCSGGGCVALGTLLTASGQFSTALGRRASTAGFSGSFVWGDNSASVVANTAANQFVARASGGFRFRTSADLSTGCDLPAGSGVFACTSDRRAKHDFRALDPEDVLLRLSALPVESWRYRDEAGDVRHLGPTAQDFHAAFGLGPDGVSIGLLDIDGVNMLAIQALAARTEALARKDAEIDELKAKVDALAAAVAALQAAAR